MLVLLFLFGLPLGYYVYTGFKAFRIEAQDFQPTPYHTSAEAERSLQAISGVTELVRWQVPHAGTQQAYYLAPQNGAVLTYLHGSPGNGAGFREMVLEMAEFGFGALVIDLPGYGASQGARNWGPHFVASVRAGLDYLERQPGVDPGRLLILGYSQGACIASRTAAADPRVAGLVLMAGYTNLRDQLHHQFRWRLPGIGLFAIAAARRAGVDMDRMDSLAALESAGDPPLLVISGTEDGLIPPDMARALAGASTRGELWLITGADHLNIPEKAGPELYRRMAEFAARATNRNSDTPEQDEHV